MKLLITGTGGGGGGTGTVTSITMPVTEFLVTNPTTAAVVTWIAQNPNIVFAGPTAGAPAVPGFRSLVAADLPSITSTTMWTRTGAVVHLTTITDQVGIGTAAPSANVKLQLVGTGAGSLGALYITAGDASSQYIVMDAGAGASAYLTFRGNAPAAMAMGALFTAGSPTDYVFTNPSGDTMLSLNVSERALRFFEAIGSGTNFTSFAAPALAADVKYVLPNAQGAASTVLTNDGAGNLSWAAAGGGSAAWESTGGQFRAKPASVTAGDYFYYNPSVADSGTNAAHVFDNSVALTTATKLASFRNNTAEKAYILNDGSVIPTTDNVAGLGACAGGVAALRWKNICAYNSVSVCTEGTTYIAVSTLGVLSSKGYGLFSEYLGSQSRRNAGVVWPITDPGGNPGVAIGAAIDGNGPSAVTLSAFPTSYLYINTLAAVGVGIDLGVQPTYKLGVNGGTYGAPTSYFTKSATSGGNFSRFYDSTEVERDDGTNVKFVSRIVGLFAAFADANATVAIGSFGGVAQVAYGAGGASAVGAGITATAVAGETKLTNGSSGTGSLLAKMVLTPYVALTSGASVAVDANLSNMFTLTLAGNVTLANPTNPRDGQKITFRIKQSAGGGNTVAFDTKYRFGTDIAAYTMTATADKVDYISVIYEVTADKWDIVAIVKGY